MIRGVIRGKTIELDAETGLPEGQEVTVTVRAVGPTQGKQSVGEGLKRAFAGWDDDDAGLDVTADVSRKFGELRASLLDAGQATPDLDLLIAATGEHDV